MGERRSHTEWLGFAIGGSLVVLLDALVWLIVQVETAEQRDHEIRMMEAGDAE